jgi:hypothetical protein
MIKCVIGMRFREHHGPTSLDLANTNRHNSGRKATRPERELLPSQSTNVCAYERATALNGDVESRSVILEEASPAGEFCLVV